MSVLIIIIILRPPNITVIIYLTVGFFTVEIHVKNMNSELVDLRGEFNSFLSSIFKSILESREKQSYLNELTELEILKPRLSELEVVIKKIIDNQSVGKIQDIVTVNDLVRFFIRHMPDRSKEEFYRKLEPLYHRNWEKDGRKLDSDLIEKL